MTFEWKITITLGLLLGALGLWMGGPYRDLKPHTTNLPQWTPAPPGPKRYVMWNAKEFERKPGAQVFTQSLNLALSQVGAKNIVAMPLINGVTFEGDIDEQKIKAVAAPAGWQIQEEQEHHVLAFSCSRCESIACPSDPQPIPKCPSPPGAGPCPVDPNPVESSKSWGRARVRAPEALAVPGVDTSQVKVCVIDTGIDMNHPNKGNVIGSIGFAGAVQDGAGHGTHTAGTIAGTGGIGISRAKLLICKGLSDSGSGSSSGLAQCLTWCGQQGAQIVSNSWGGGGPDQMINQAIAGLTARGIAVVVSNGNDGRGTLSWPAQLAINNPLVFGSAASDQRDQRASFSTYGPGTKFISPGVDIVSNRPGGGTQTMSGTSMSAPHLSGIMAFCIARGLLPSCVKSSGVVGGYPFADALLTVQ